MNIYPSKVDYERILNESIPMPKEINGEKVKGHPKRYGTWLRTNDNESFNKFYEEWKVNKRKTRQIVETESGKKVSMLVIETIN